MELQSDLTVHLADLSPAELTFHRQLLQLRDSTLPRFQRKLEELQRKSAIMVAKQRELQQAQKALKHKGLAGEGSHKAWTEEQMHALQPVIANQYGSHTHTTQLRGEHAWLLGPCADRVSVCVVCVWSDRRPSKLWWISWPN